MKEIKLQLLDINEFIKRNDIKQVTSTEILLRKGTPHPDGLWSEKIFGLMGSKERYERFGYIDLHEKTIHPEVYPIIETLSTDIKNLLNCKHRYILEDGKLITNSSGKTGINFFIEIFDKLDFESLPQKDNTDAIVTFLKKNRDLIFVDKWLVIPAAIRDLHFDPTSSRISYSEINTYYLDLLRLVNMRDQFDTEFYLNNVNEHLQKISTWIKNKQSGKHGVFRGLLLRKVTDFSARCVITIDTSIPLGKIGVPWHTLFVLYEPFCFHYIMKKDPVLKKEIQDFLKVDELTIDNLKEFSLIIIRDYDIIPPNLKELIIKMVSEITKDKQLLYKRDPVVSRTNWRAGEIIVTDTHSIVLNPLDLAPLSGDIDGDTVAIFAVFSKKANEAAKTLNPRYNKINYYDPVTTTGLSYSISLDAVATIFDATKE